MRALELGLEVQAVPYPDNIIPFPQASLDKIIKGRSAFVDETIRETPNNHYVIPGELIGDEWNVDPHSLDNPKMGVYGADLEEANLLNDPRHETSRIRENLQNVLNHPTTRVALSSAAAVALLVPVAGALTNPGTVYAQDLSCAFYPDEGNWMLVDGEWFPCDDVEVAGSVIDGTGLEEPNPGREDLTLPQDQQPQEELLAQNIEVPAVGSLSFDLRVVDRGARTADVGFRAGRFFSAPNGEISFPRGYVVGNDDEASFWNAYQNSPNLGSPLGNRFQEGDGSVVQVFENGLIKLNPEGQIEVLRGSNFSGIVPAEAKKGIFFDTLPIAPGMRLQNNWHTIDVWNEIAANQGKKVSQLLLENQRQHGIETGTAMQMPKVQNVEVWKELANEANMNEVDFLMKAFYGDLPFDGPIERQALAEINQIRTENGRLPVTLNRYAVLASRAEAIYVLIHWDMFTNDPSLSTHRQIPGTVGYTARIVPERVLYFGGHIKVGQWSSENGGGGNDNNPITAFEGWMTSSAHKALILSDRDESEGLKFGFATAKVGQVPYDIMVLGNFS